MKPCHMPFALIVLGLALVGCATKTEQASSNGSQMKTSGITVSPYGILPDGREVMEYTMTNTAGMTMKVINYGGIVTSLIAPDADGKLQDIVLGFDSLDQYVANNPYFGCLIGRYGNRIANGAFTLEGTTYTLAKNNGQNHLHGGSKGFDKVFWHIEEYESPDGPALRLTYHSADMEEGYPGNLDVEVIYVLTDRNEWKIQYKATTDKKTIVNLTQHTYFNLSGDTRSDILNHELQMNAEGFIPVDETLIPSGEIQSVEGTPFDFRLPFAIGDRIDHDHVQIQRGGGYDHCWVLNGENGSMKHAATLTDPSSGRIVKVYTTEPGIQFYSGNFLDGSLTGKYETVYARRYGLCLETQHFPDSPNRPDFPAVVLNPGEVYQTETIYSFSVVAE